MIKEHTIYTEFFQSSICSLVHSFNHIVKVLVTETWFGLVAGCINRLQLVTTNNYNTVPDFHSINTPRQSSESIPTCLHSPFPGNGSRHRNYHRLTFQISLHRASLNYS
jgi:hypothetical protein